MKNLTLVFIALLFSLITVAQKKPRNAVEDIDRENFFRIGAKAGFNVNRVPGIGFAQGYNLNYELGGFMQFNFSRRFGLQPEVNFLQSTSSAESESSDIMEDVRDNRQIASRFNYMQVPILLNMNLGESRHVKLQFGPAYGFYLHNSTQAKTSTQTEQYKNGELTAIGGLWIQLPFVNIGGRYKYGLNKVYNELAQQSIHNQAIEVFAGFTF